MLFTLHFQCVKIFFDWRLLCVVLLFKGAPKKFFGFTFFSYFLGWKPVHSTQNLVLDQKPFCHHGGPPRGLLEGTPFIGTHFSVT
jgi:hypothetical protein